MKTVFTARVLLVLVLILAGFLRLWQLGNIPPNASLDEASIGYNAYSVLKTGADEFGQFPLVSQRGYDDWRRSTYLFLVVPFVAVLDLTVVAVRLPAAILSILTVWAAYHIVLLLFAKDAKRATTIALLTALLLAVSPWHVYISRLGHESNACLSFLVFGMLFFLQGISKKSWKRVLLSMLFFTLSMISYYSGQALIPLLVFGLFLIYRKSVFPLILHSKKAIVSFSIFLVFLVPVFWSVFSPQAMIRFQGTSTFKPEAHAEMFAKRVELRNRAAASHDIVGSIIYNHRLFPIQVFLEGYFSHFKPSWLFTNSSQESFKIPNLGLLYLWELPFLLLGIISLFFSKNIDGKTKKYIFLWFVLAPLPAALATQAPHAMRSYNFLPTWQIFTAFGIVFVLYKLGKYKLVGYFSVCVLIAASLFMLYNNYFVIFPKGQSRSFQYALGKTIPYVLAEQNKYQKIAFSNQDHLYQSYMHFLFHTRYDPVLYQKQGGTKSGGYAETHSFGKYVFEPITKSIGSEEAVLFVANPKERERGLVLFEGKYLDGSVGTVVYTQPSK